MVRKRETRSKVTTLTLRPSVHEKLQKISHMTGFAINSIINDFLEGYVLKHQNIINQYDEKYSKGDA